MTYQQARQIVDALPVWHPLRKEAQKTLNEFYRNVLEKMVAK